MDGPCLDQPSHDVPAMRRSPEFRPPGIGEGSVLLLRLLLALLLVHRARRALLGLVLGDASLFVRLLDVLVLTLLLVGHSHRHRSISFRAALQPLKRSRARAC